MKIKGNAGAWLSVQPPGPSGRLTGVLVWLDRPESRRGQYTLNAGVSVRGIALGVSFGGNVQGVPE